MACHPTTVLAGRVAAGGVRGKGMVMRWLDRMPGQQRTPAGLEWWLWKRLPAVFAWGSALPVAVVAWLWFTQPDPMSALQQRDLWLAIYRLMGVVALHWTLVLTVAIGCIIVMVMKGPAYTADAYPLPQRDPG